MREVNLICGVEGCQNPWAVHIHGQRPLCAKHFREKNKPEIPKPSVLPELKEPPPSWWNEEKF